MGVKRAHLLLQAGDAEALITCWIQQLAQHPAALSRLGGVAVSHPLVLLGQGVATCVLLVGRAVQGGFGVRGVRQGTLSKARAHGVRGQVPLVGRHGGGGAALLVQHRRGVQTETGVGVCVGGEVCAVGVGEKAALQV